MILPDLTSVLAWIQTLIHICSFLPLQRQQRQVVHNREDKLCLKNQEKPLQSSSMNVQDHSNQQEHQKRPKSGSFAQPLQCHPACCSDFRRVKRSLEVHTITIKSTACLHLFLTAAADFSFCESQPGSSCPLQRQTENSLKGKQPLLGKFFKIILHTQKTLQRTLKSCF